MDSLEIIKYKYEQGVYDLNDMVSLVKNEIISSEDFFSITRYDYAGIAQKCKNQDKKI